MSFTGTQQHVVDGNVIHDIAYGASSADCATHDAGRGVMVQ